MERKYGVGFLEQVMQSGSIYDTKGESYENAR